MSQSDGIFTSILIMSWIFQRRWLSHRTPNTTADLSATLYISSFNLNGKSSLRLSCKSIVYFIGCLYVCSITKCNVSQRITRKGPTPEDLLFQPLRQIGLFLIQPGKVKFHFLKKTLRVKGPTVSGCCHDLALHGVILMSQTNSSVHYGFSGKAR